VNQEHITVEVAYALPDQQLIIPLQVPVGTTAEQAVMQSGILAKFSDVGLSKNQIGIFGKITRPDTALRHLDRVEIYRPLIADPKAVRKERAEQGKAMKKGGGDAPPST
jgi:uncharacterized protein